MSAARSRFNGNEGAAQHCLARRHEPFTFTHAAPWFETRFALLTMRPGVPAEYPKNYVVAAAGTIILSCRRVGPPARIWTTPAVNPISVPICQAWS